MKSVASATITLGMVAIPVKFYLAAGARNVGFNMVSPSGNRVKQKIVDAVTGEEVDRGSCGRGFEVNKDVFVEFSKDEIASLGEDGNGSVEIDSFIPRSTLDPVRIEKSYFIAPERGSERPYALLLNALQRTEKMFIARWVNRGKRHVLAVAPKDGTLVAHQMFLDDEVRSLSVSAPAKGPSEMEMDMALKLVEVYSKDSLDLSSYENDFEKRVRALAEQKLDGGGVVQQTALPAHTVLDLLEALKKTIEEKK